MITAVAFIPEDHPLDGVYARRCLDHMEQHHYRLRAIIRTWDQLDQVIRANTAEVIVFARREHFFRIWKPRIEFVAQSSVEPHRPDLVRHIAGRHRRRPRRLS